MTWRGAGDKMEDVTESEREPLILGHSSPHALLSSSHFYLQDSPSLLHFIPRPHGHNSVEHSCVSGCGPPWFHKARSKRSGLHQSAVVWHIADHSTDGRVRTLLCQSLPQSQRDYGKAFCCLLHALQWCKNKLKCHLFSRTPSGFPVMKLLWQLSINKASVNTKEEGWGYV